MEQINEPEEGWANSRAKRILQKDMLNGHVPMETGKMSTMDIYQMHEEYSRWRYEKFGRRIRDLRASLKKKTKRAEDDEEAFRIFVEQNPVSFFSAKGYIQWQGNKSHIIHYSIQALSASNYAAVESSSLESSASVMISSTKTSNNGCPISILY